MTSSYRARLTARLLLHHAKKARESRIRHVPPRSAAVTTKEKT